METTTKNLPYFRYLKDAVVVDYIKLLKHLVYVETHSLLSLLYNKTTMSTQIKILYIFFTLYPSSKIMRGILSLSLRS